MGLIAGLGLLLDQRLGLVTFSLLQPHHQLVGVAVIVGGGGGDLAAAVAADDEH